MTKFELKVDTSSDPVKISISGALNETTDFKPIDLTGKSGISIDLNDIRSINSLGSMAWIKWMNSLSNTKIQFYNCPKIIIDQFNMVGSLFLKNAQVMSFYVPFYNEDSGEEKNVLFRFGKDYTEKGVEIPKDITDSLGLPMEIGVIEKRYFSFLFKNR